MQKILDILIHFLIMRFYGFGAFIQVFALDLCRMRCVNSAKITKRSLYELECHFWWSEF